MSDGHSVPAHVLERCTQLRVALFGNDVVACEGLRACRWQEPDADSAKPTGDLKAALARVQEIGTDEAFHMLFAVACADTTTCRLVSTAATLLLKTGLPCPLSARETVLAVLPDWNVSIEEVPFYLAGALGRDRVFETIRELQAEALPADQLVRLRTIVYWLGGEWEPERPVAWRGFTTPGLSSE